MLLQLPTKGAVWDHGTPTPHPSPRPVLCLCYLYACVPPHSPMGIWGRLMVVKGIENGVDGTCSVKAG